MAPHSSTLAWKIWMEEPGRLQSMGSLRVDTTERLHFHFSLSCIEEGNGNPLQYSCLESPRGGGACWAAIYGVARSRTWLKRLSSSSSRKDIDLKKILFLLFVFLPKFLTNFHKLLICFCWAFNKEIYIKNDYFSSQYFYLLKISCSISLAKDKEKM